MSPRPRHDPVQRVNAHRAGDLLAIAKAFGGPADATAARATRVDLDGVDLVIDTPRGPVTAHVGFGQDADPRRLRASFLALAGRAHAALAADRAEPDAV